MPSGTNYGMNLPALWKDPRVIGSGVAILWLLVDDHPKQSYSTFWDPGAAMMQSIIVGEFTALAVQRQWDPTSVGWFIAAFLFKLTCQGLFYVRNAMPLDLMTLLIAHLIVAVLAVKKYNFSAVSIRCGIAIVSFLLAFAFCSAVYEYTYGISGNQDGDFWAFAAARAIFPYLLWSSLMLISARGVRKHVT